MQEYSKVGIYIKGQLVATIRNCSLEYAKNSAYLMYVCDYDDIEVKVMEE